MPVTWYYSSTSPATACEVKFLSSSAIRSVRRKIWGRVWSVSWASVGEIGEKDGEEKVKNDKVYKPEGEEKGMGRLRRTNCRGDG